MATDGTTEVNRQYYNQLDAGQEAYWNHMPAPAVRRLRIIEMIKSGPEPEVLLDFGCGNGSLLRSLHTAFPKTKLCGLDLSETQIAENRRNAPWAHWLTHDLCANVELDHPADTIVCSEVIEHVPAPDRLVANALRNLVPSGRFILSTQSGPIRETERYVGHVRHWSGPEMIKLLNDAGFSRICGWNEGFPFHDLSKAIANIRPSATIQSFGKHEYGFIQMLVCRILKTLFRLNSRHRGAQLFACGCRPPE